ncbi:uncharacterized protein [Drosophila bipectinata]|uniref:uncharacterized protein n=1 Tax=Drosophila bipectinata TaxID=42026 RepID=UPI0038B3E171
MKPNHQKFQKAPPNGSGEKPKTIPQAEHKLQQQQKQQQSPQAAVPQGGKVDSSGGQAMPKKNQNQGQNQNQNQGQPLKSASEVPPAEGSMPENSQKKQQKNPQQQQQNRQPGNQQKQMNPKPGQQAQQPKGGQHQNQNPNKNHNVNQQNGQPQNKAKPQQQQQQHQPQPQPHLQQQQQQQNQIQNQKMHSPQQQQHQNQAHKNHNQKNQHHKMHSPQHQHQQQQQHYVNKKNQNQQPMQQQFQPRQQFQHRPNGPQQQQQQQHFFPKNRQQQHPHQNFPRPNFHKNFERQMQQQHQQQLFGQQQQHLHHQQFRPPKYHYQPNRQQHHFLPQQHQSLQHIPQMHQPMAPMQQQSFHSLNIQHPSLQQLNLQQPVMPRPPFHKPQYVQQLPGQSYQQPQFQPQMQYMPQQQQQQPLPQTLPPPPPPPPTIPINVPNLNNGFPRVDCPEFVPRQRIEAEIEAQQPSNESFQSENSGSFQEANWPPNSYQAPYDWRVLSNRVHRDGATVEMVYTGPEYLPQSGDENCSYAARPGITRATLHLPQGVLPTATAGCLPNMPSLINAMDHFANPDRPPPEGVLEPKTTVTMIPVNIASGKPQTFTIEPMGCFEASPLDPGALNMAFQSYSLMDLNLMEKTGNRDPNCSIFNANLSPSFLLTPHYQHRLQAAVLQTEIPLLDALMPIIHDIRSENAQMTRMGHVPMMMPAYNASMHIYQDDPNMDPGMAGSGDLSGDGAGFGEAGAGHGEGAAGFGGTGAEAGFGDLSGDMGGYTGQGGTSPFEGAAGVNGLGAGPGMDDLDGIRVTGFDDGYGGLVDGSSQDEGTYYPTYYPYGSLPMPQIVNPNYEDAGSAVSIPPDFTYPPPGYPEAPRPVPDFSQPPPEFARH